MYIVFYTCILLIVVKVNCKMLWHAISWYRFKKFKIHLWLFDSILILVILITLWCIFICAKYTKTKQEVTTTTHILFFKIAFFINITIQHFSIPPDNLKKYFNEKIVKNCLLISLVYFFIFFLNLERTNEF